MDRAYWLMGVHGSVRRIRLPIRGSILIGRGTYNHVVLADPRGSRQHARIALEDDGVVLYDLGSMNGTFVNGYPVTRCSLKLNDEISFGTITFRITSGSQELGGDGPAGEFEERTMRDVGSVSRMAVSQPAGPRDSSQALAVVDLGQLEDAYEKLGTLYSFMKAISHTIVTKDLLVLIAAQTKEIYRSASSVGIYVQIAGVGSRSSDFKLAYAMGEVPAILPEAIALAGKPMLSVPAPGRMSGGTHMHAPLTSHDEVVGMLYVASDPLTGGFSRADLDLLAGMAAPAGMMLQNANSHAAQLEHDRMDHDLELAAQIQKSFLPREVVSVEGVELYAAYTAAYSVGGDFYDVFWVGPDRLGIFVGDIAGKGVAGALLMARISGEMRLAALAHVEPVLVMRTLNEALLGRNQPELFFTAIYLTFNVKTGDVVLANAGHPPPYWARGNGRFTKIVAGSAGPVGILDNATFESTSFRLQHGESLVLYTDGVIEATNERGTLYGEERLEMMLATTTTTMPSAIAEEILTSVADHAGETPANDDITLLICQRDVGRPHSMQPRRRSGTLNAV